MVDLIARQLFSPNFTNENFFKFLKMKLSRRMQRRSFFWRQRREQKVGGGVLVAAAFGGGVHH